MVQFSSLMLASTYFLPALEFTLGSVFSLTLLGKTTARGNFSIAIAYSSLKLLAICSFLSSNLNVFGLAHLPFLLGLLINEVVLLVISIRVRPVILVIPFGTLYTMRIRVIRFISEISTIVVVLCVFIGLPFVPCSCDVVEQEIFFGYLQQVCKKSNVEKIFEALLSDQIRGLAFAITVTASIAAVSSMRFLASSVGREVCGKADRDVVQWMMMDAQWKQIIRTVYGIIGILVNVLFAGSFFYHGTNHCLVLADDKGERFFRYGLGKVPSSLLNSTLAISQVFMADMLLRISAKSEELQFKKEDLMESGTDTDSDVTE